MIFHSGFKAIVVILLCSGSACWAQWRNQVAAYSDYFHRGLTYREQPSSLSWLSEYHFKNGLYAGFWAGAHNDDSALHGKEEFDFWLGFMQPISNSLVIDCSVTEFSYPNDRIFEYDWREVLIALHYTQHWTFTAGINRDRFGDGDKGYVTEVNYRTIWKKNLMDVSIGYSENDIFGYDRFINGSFDGDGYINYEIGISRELESWYQLRMRLALIGTDQQDTVIFGQMFSDKELILSLHYDF